MPGLDRRLRRDGLEEGLATSAAQVGSPPSGSGGFARFGPAVVVHREEAADVREAVFLRRHRAAVGEENSFPVFFSLASGPNPFLARLDGYAFSAKRQASRKKGFLNRSHRARTPRRFSSETGWPPPELFVTVTITSGTWSPRSSRSRSPQSTLTKGWRRPGCARDHGSVAARRTMLARGGSKGVVFRTIARPSGWKESARRRGPGAWG